MEWSSCQGEDEIFVLVWRAEELDKLLRNEKMVESITERHPLKKILDPSEVAKMASFLISDNALSISGQIFKIDCGIVTFKI